MFQNIHKLALFFIPFNSNLKLWIGKIEGFNPQAHFHISFPPGKICPIFDLKEILNNDAFDMNALEHLHISFIRCTFRTYSKIRPDDWRLSNFESLKKFSTKPQNPKLRIEIIIGKVRTRVPNKNEIHFNDYYARKRFPWTLLYYSTDDR